MPVVKGTSANLKGRSPKTPGKGKVRVCAKLGCETVLNQYNKKEYCHAHIPSKFRIIPKDDSEVLMPTEEERQLLETSPSTRNPA